LPLCETASTQISCTSSTTLRDENGVGQTLHRQRPCTGQDIRWTNQNRIVSLSRRLLGS
jgi:hypothetical protein